MASFSNLTIGIAVASFTVFQLLFHVLSSWVSTRITPGFNNLSQKRKIEWNSRTVSTFHALVVGGFCLYILLYDDAVNADRLWGDPSIVKLNIAITTGYLISDLLLIVHYWKAIGDKFFVIHHLAALYAYYFVLSKGLLAYFGNFRLLAEFSTPFVNQRSLSSSSQYVFLWRGIPLPGWAVTWSAWIFIVSVALFVNSWSISLRAGCLANLFSISVTTQVVICRWFFEVLGYPKSSKANIVNGVLMTVVFFVVRIAVMPVYYSHVISSFGTEAFQRLGFAAQSAWIISSVVLDVMNVMWMVKIAKGCYKVICLIGREEAKTHRNGKSD